jgi:hypothetical protein
MFSTHRGEYVSMVQRGGYRVQGTQVDRTPGRARATVMRPIVRSLRWSISLGICHISVAFADCVVSAADFHQR